MTYDSVVLSDSPTHYYATAETSGSTAVDSAGSANASLTGSGITYGVTILGESGFEFTPGTYFAASVASIAVQGTWECLIQVFSDTGNWANVGYSTEDNAPASTGNRNLGTLFGDVDFSTEGIGVGSGYALSAGSYHLAGVQKSDGSQYVYVNGVLASSDVPGSQTPSTASGGAVYFPMGTFDTDAGHVAFGKIAYYDGVALSGTRIAAHYAALGGGGGGGTAMTGSASLTLSAGGSAVGNLVASTAPSTPDRSNSVRSDSFSATGGGTGSEFQVEVLDKKIERPPSAITVVVAGGIPEADITFALDRTPLPPLFGSRVDVYTTQLDSDGSLGPTSLGITNDIGGIVGTRTVYATQGSVESTDTYTVKRAGTVALTAQGPDADPVALPDAVQDGVRKWVFQDLAPVEDGGIGSYILPINPSSMTSPHQEYDFTSRHSTAMAGNFHVFQAGNIPKEWTFSGVCATQEMYEALLAYAGLNRRFYVIDHHNRAWKTVFTNLEITPRLRTNWNGELTDWFQDYTVTAVITDQDPVTPV